MKTLYKLLAIVMVLSLMFTALPSMAVSADAVEVNPGMQAGADRLTALQNDDGGWDWPLDDGNPANTSPVNTIGPIGMGLAQAYRYTGDVNHLAALEAVGDLLLSKVGNFSPSDGYLAAKLDEVFGVTIYTDYVKANFYDLLATGTYYRSAAPTVFYTTAAYIDRIRTSRSGTQANLAAWDIGMGLVGAAACGADTTAWIAGTKAEIDELVIPAYYDVVGLAGALYGLAYVNEEYDPAAGPYAAASNLADLATALASYQIDGGGFAWETDFVIPNDYNEAIQETAYAILALNEVDRAAYLDEIRGAADYMLSVQLANGGWYGDEYYDEENNEITGEALWGIAATYPMPEVWVCPTGDCGHPGFQFASVQSGINAVDPDGIVHVLPGTYAENTTITKALTLQGPGMVETFTDPVVTADTQTPGAWYTDRYAPAVFESYDFHGEQVLKHSVSEADSAANRPSSYSSTFYNTQGRKLDINLSGPVQTFSIDLWVDGSWTTEQQTAGLWATGFDSGDAISAYPILAWRNVTGETPGFYYFDYIYGGYHLIKEATEEDYSKWHTLSFVLNVGTGVDFVVDGVALHSFADPDTVSLGNVILNVYNFGADYDVYWDNFSTFDATVTGQMTIDASDVKVDGLNLRNPNQPYGMLIKVASSDIDITNNLIEKIGSPSLTANVKGIYLQYGPDNVNIVGNIFRDIHANASSVNAIFSGDSNSASPAEGLVISNNTFENITSQTKGGYGILLNNGAGNPAVEITDNAFRGIAGGWTHAIGLEGPTLDAVITGNTFADLTALSVDNAAVFFEVNPVGDTVDVSYNQFNGDGFYGVLIHPTKPGGAYTVDASPNWFNTVVGPSDTQVYGSIISSPWCGDQFCTFLIGDNWSDDLQTMIDLAPEGSTIVAPAGNYSHAGGYHVDRPHLTILLMDGTVIENESPCFTINASYTTITTESIGGAKCIPTDGANGIDVAADLENIVIEGLEITKGATDTGDGIHFDGVVTDTVLVNNWIHGLDANGIFFGGEPVALTEGAIDIHGNLFQDNEGNGIEAGDFYVPALYNSWGSEGGPFGDGGDGISTNIDSDPWTHVDLYLVSSGTDWENQVVEGDQITYAVKAHMVNVNAADFMLTYDSSLLSVSDVVPGTDFVGLLTDDDPLTYADLVDASVPGELHFSGFKMGGTVDGDITLFTVTFDADDAGTSALNFDEDTDLFGMPAAGSSENIYAAALTDGSVQVIELPTIEIVLMPEGSPDPCLAGLPCAFQLHVTNPALGMTPTAPWYVNFTAPTGAVIEFDDGGTWEVITSPWEMGGVDPDVTVTPTFRITFLDPGVNTLTVELMDPAPDPDFMLDDDTQDFTTLGNFSLTGTFSMQGRTARAGIPVTLTWGETLVSYAPAGSTIEQISNNLLMTLIYGGDYTITTNQPRYLNVTASLGKVVNVSDATTMTKLELKGGNAVWTDNIINILDAVMVGTTFGTTGDGDVNFDGKINIQDLALVGGNYSLTSATAYSTWVP